MEEKLVQVLDILYTAAGGSTSRFLFLKTPKAQNKILVDLGYIKPVGNSKKLEMYVITPQLKKEIEDGNTRG